MNEKKPSCFFLGANTGKGYYSRFDELMKYDPGEVCLLLKGGPGTGKSTILKKIAAALGEKGRDCELIYCTADTDSLDAVTTEDGAFCAVDATAPHTVEPKYPGAYETVLSLSEFWNGKEIRRNSEKIAELFERNKSIHEQARKYIASATVLLDSVTKLSSEAVMPEKVVATAVKICKKEFGKKKNSTGRERIRFLSAVTDKGITFLSSTASTLCEKLYVVDDEYGAVSRIFMNTVRKLALDYGLEIITCRCGAFPSERNEHILIPKLGLGFVTSNKRHRIEGEPYRMIHARRFFDEEKQAQNRNKIRFALKTASQLFAEASLCMKEAKQVHDELEGYYIRAMDFSRSDEKLKEILDML